MKTELKYKTFDELMAEVTTDFTSYSTEGMIEPGQLIKVAQRVNYDLGLKIHQTREKVLDICNRKAKLPDDFYVLNYGVLCGQYKTVSRVPSGRHTEDVILNTPCNRCGHPDPECTCEKTYTMECQNGEQIFVQVVEKRTFETRIYQDFEKIHLRGTGCSTSAYCPGAPNSGYIKNGWMYLSIESGTAFICYEGMLEDELGNLLVLDHPMINEYYEYAMKARILENLFIGGEEVTTRMQLIEQRLKTARNNALGIVNTPDFQEMLQNWAMNRRIMYNKYYEPFSY